MDFYENEFYQNNQDQVCAKAFQYSRDFWCSKRADIAQLNNLLYFQEMGWNHFHFYDNICTKHEDVKLHWRHSLIMKTVQDMYWRYIYRSLQVNKKYQEKEEKKQPAMDTYQMIKLWNLHHQISTRKTQT